MKKRKRGRERTVKNDRNRVHSQRIYEGLYRRTDGLQSSLLLIWAIRSDAKLCISNVVGARAYSMLAASCERKEQIHRLNDQFNVIFICGVHSNEARTQSET